MSSGAPYLGTTGGTRVDQATFCVITIERDAAGIPIGLAISPSRPGASSVFYSRGSLAPSPPPPRTDLPRHVVWFVDDLRQGERIQIATKSQQYNPFAWPTLDITPPKHRASSGPVVKLPWEAGLQSPAFWHYNVTLEANGRAAVVLDPTIIIEEDP